MSARRILLGILGGVVLAGCSGAGEHPLGGPYGGTGEETPPSAGDVTPVASGDVDAGAGGQIGGGTGSGTGTEAGTGGTGSGTGGATDAGSGGGAVDAGSGTGGGAVDSGTVSPPPPAPTWAQIYASYLSASSNGQCGLSACHTQMSTAAGAYSWLKSKGHINGTSSKLVSPSTSRLTWYGGDMPPRGPTTWTQAVTDMNAWAQAGALQN